MDQRLSMITLGVDDVARARAFYEKLGWKAGNAADADVAFFQCPGMILGLWDRASLAEDSGLPLSDGGAGGISTPAINFASPEEVDAVLAEAQDAGARIARKGAPTFWGGYSGVFVDPDGHAWEVAHNPHWTISSDGSTKL
jgi:catechol 2,3-dioxygenase-like lactoylglutathione lyase family enzyme